MSKRAKPRNDAEKVDALSPQQKIIFALWCQGWTLRRIAGQFQVSESAVQQQFLRIVRDKFEIDFYDIAERNTILKQRFCPEIAKLGIRIKPPLLLPAPTQEDPGNQEQTSAEEEFAQALMRAEEDAIEEGRPPETALALFRALIPRTTKWTGIGPPAVIDVVARPVRRGLPPLLTFILGILTVAGLLGLAYWRGFLPITTQGAPLLVPQTVVVQQTVSVEKTIVLTQAPLSTLTPPPTQTPQPTFTPQPTQSPFPTYTPLPPLPTYTPPPTTLPLIEAVQTPTVAAAVTASAELTATLPFSVPFVDTFDKDKRPEWRLAEGNYLVEGGRLSPGTAGTFILELGDASLRDYTVELDYTGIFIYRFGDSLRLNVDTSVGYDCSLQTLQDNQWVKLRDIACPPGGHFKAQLSGNTFSVTYNSTPIFDFAYETQSKIRGPFRFRIQSGTLDNVKFTIP